MSKKLTLSAMLSVLAMAGVALFAPQTAAEQDRTVLGLFSASTAGPTAPVIGALLPSLR